MMFRRHSTGLVFGASALLVLALILALALMNRRPHAQVSREPLLVYCAANLRVPIEEIAKDYERETGVRISSQFAGSQTMLTNAEVSKRGDLFLPADESYIELARQKGMVAQTYSLASMRPVLAVKQGNRKNIRSIDDLLTRDLTIAQANPDAAAIGKVTRPVLQNAGLWDKLAAHTRTFQPTVTDVANAVKLGTVDAGIVWDTTVKQTDGLEAIDLPVFANTQSHIVIAVLKSSAQPAAANAFALYASKVDKGLQVFERYGYRVDGAAHP
jgi:molybdate transport system substrate-binding protein